MDNQQSQIPQPPHNAINTPPVAHKSSPLLMILGALFFLFLGAVGGYLFANSTKPAVVEKAQVDIPPSLPAETKNLPMASKDITVRPINEKQFEREVISDEECGQIVGMVQYSNQSNDGRKFNVMSINNFSISDSQEAKADLQIAADVLEGKRKLSPFENFGHIEGAFRASCAGYYTLFVKELPDISYPGADQVKAFMTIEGQDLFGSVDVQVLARVGDDFIYLTKNINEFPQLDTYKDSCNNPTKDITQELMQKAEDCYRKKIASDKTIEESAITQAKGLMKLFSIK